MCLHRVRWGLLWVCFRSAFGSVLNVNDSIEFSTKDLIGRRSDCSKRFVNYHMTSLSIRPDPMFTFRMCFWNWGMLTVFPLGLLCVSLGFALGQLWVLPSRPEADPGRAQKSYPGFVGVCSLLSCVLSN